MDPYSKALHEDQKKVIEVIVETIDKQQESIDTLQTQIAMLSEQVLRIVDTMTTMAEHIAQLKQTRG